MAPSLPESLNRGCDASRRQCCNFDVAAQEMHDADVFHQIVIWNSLAMKWSWRTI
jgi:hypothetical protein